MDDNQLLGRDERGREGGREGRRREGVSRAHVQSPHELNMEECEEPPFLSRSILSSIGRRKPPTIEQSRGRQDDPPTDHETTCEHGAARP